MPIPLLDEVVDRKATWGTIGLLIGVWWILTSRRLGYLDVGMSYEKAVNQREVWRILTAQLSHIEPVHLGLNCLSLWSYGFVENRGWGAGMQGSIPFLGTSFLLLLLSGVISLAIYHVLVVFLHKEQFLNVTVVGYSAVLFGWMTLYAFTVGGTFVFMGLEQVHIPMILAPVIYLLVTQLVIRRASFVGHLSGILSGALVATGIFNGLIRWSLLLLIGAALCCICCIGYFIYKGNVSLPFNAFQEEQRDMEAGNSSNVPLIPPNE